MKAPDKKPSRLRQHLNKHHAFYRYASLTVAFIVIVGIVWFAFFRAQNQVTRTSNQTGRAPSANVTSTLTGEKMNSILAERAITGVIIENTPQARPQSGLIDAGVVFEAMEEGGITRHLALYQAGNPELIGPIRSLRMHHIDWALGFDSSVAHVGGSGQALSRAAATSEFRDLDQMKFSNSFFRSSDRYAPHNMYSRMKLLRELSKKEKFTDSDFTSIKRQKEPKDIESTVTTINIPFTSRLYAVEYRYEPVTNSYRRYLAGNPHKDRESEKHISPKVIVVLKTSLSRDPEGHSIYGTTSGGEATIFQNGQQQNVSWSKSTTNSQFEFSDQTGKKIGLNPGQTWFEIVPSDMVIGSQ